MMTKCDRTCSVQRLNRFFQDVAPLAAQTINLLQSSPFPLAPNHTLSTLQLDQSLCIRCLLDGSWHVTSSTRLSALDSVDQTPNVIIRFPSMHPEPIPCTSVHSSIHNHVHNVCLTRSLCTRNSVPQFQGAKAAACGMCVDAVGAPIAVSIVVAEFEACGLCLPCNIRACFCMVQTCADKDRFPQPDCLTGGICTAACEPGPDN